MLHLRGGVKEMDKKDTELKKEETKKDWTVHILLTGFIGLL